MTDLDEPLKRLLRDPADPPVDALWSRISERVSRNGQYGRRTLPQHSRYLLLAPALGFVVALVAVKLGWVAPTSSAARLSLADGQPMSVLETTSAGRAVALSDGSRIELSPATRLVARTVGPGLFATELAHGRATFDVVPHGPRRWLVLASEVQVSVLGTRFMVEKLAGGIQVSVERGVVEVTGPNVLRGSRRVTAHQTLFVPQLSGHSHLPPSAAKAARAPATADTSSAAQPASPAISQPAQTATANVGSSHVREPDSVVQLLARADAARLANQPQQAAAALSRVVARYPDDARAALAAFTLGKVYLEQLANPALAAAAFEKAQTLGLPQALAEEGAAKLVEAYSKSQQIARALTARASYRAQFPNGNRRVAVEAWTRTF